MRDRQADRPHLRELLPRHGLAQSDHCQVIVQCGREEPLVNEDILYGQVEMGVGLGLRVHIPVAQPYQQLPGKVGLDAVGGSDEVPGVQQRRPAKVAGSASRGDFEQSSVPRVLKHKHMDNR